MNTNTKRIVYKINENGTEEVTDLISLKKNDRFRMVESTGETVFDTREGKENISEWVAFSDGYLGNNNIGTIDVD